MRVLIVDEHLLIRNGLKQFLNEEQRGVIFGEAKTADEALLQIGNQPWDLVILDINLPGKDGFYLLQEALLRRPSLRMLVLTARADPIVAARALTMGAQAYISKNAGRAQLLKAFRSVCADEQHVDKSIPRPLTVPPRLHDTKLSAREYSVMTALVAGKRIGEIAADLHLSPKTVSTYARRLLNKLHLRSTSELVSYVNDRAALIPPAASSGSN